MTIEVVDRHVQDVAEEQMHVDQAGFLDPDASGVVPVVNLVGLPQSFVLLAAGGVGKSFVLDDLQRREGGVAVDLTVLAKSEVGPAIRAAVASGRPVYMDSLDEALAADPSIAKVLIRAASSPVASSVTWRLACRPSAWTSALAGTFAGLRKLRLLPLTRDSARQLLASLKVSEDFLTVIAAAGQNRLNGSLLHFIAAAQQWSSEGRLPRERADLLDHEVRRLLEEREDLRNPLRTPEDIRYRAAGRLAAFSLFGGIRGYAFRTAGDQSTYAIANLPSDPEPDRPDATLGREVHEEVLGSALFDSAPNNTVSFRHQEYADYLAARYVVDRHPTKPQVEALLGMTDGVVPRPMASVAAWMVALNPDLADTVAPTNAVALVESGVDLPLTVRPAVVAALLAGAKAAEAGPMWALDLSVLAHPGLENQLTQQVAAGIQYPAGVWWICRLALAARTTAIASQALTLALDDRWPSWARRPAIAVVTDLGTDEQRSALLTDLALTEDADPDDELRAGLLDGLYPRHMTTTQLLPLVIWPRRHVFLGSYRMFLREFADRIPDADLPEALRWAQDNRLQHRSFEARGWMDDIAFDVAARALASSDDPTVLEPLADLVATLPPRYRKDLPWAHDATRRRRLAVAVGTRLEETAWALLLQSGLIIAADIDWLIDAVGTDAAGRQPVLEKCLARLRIEAARTLTPQDADQEVGGHAETDYGSNFHELKATIAAARDELTAWPDVPIALAQGISQSLVSCDLTERPGWPVLDADEQQNVLDRGLQYVIQHSPTPAMWLGKTSIGLDVLRDWSGVYLLTTLARHAPNRLTAIPAEAWARWASAIANAFMHDHHYLVNELAKMCPPEAKAELLAAVQAAIDARNEWRRHPLHEYFAAELAPDLAAKVRQRRYPDDQNADLLAFLIEHNPDLATETGRAVAADDGSLLSRVANRRLAAIDVNAAIDRLLRDEVPQEIFLRRVHDIQLDPQLPPSSPTPTVDDRRLTAFAGLLLDRLPLASDPPETEEWSGSWERDGTRQRDLAIEILANRGLVHDLETLAKRRTPAEQTFIRYHLRRARQAAADNAFIRPRPTDLLALLGRSDPRLIRNSADFVTATEDHLYDLQHDLRRNGSFRDLWSRDGKQLHSEDDITDWIRRRLTDCFGNDRVVMSRESQVERLNIKGIGTRVDLMMSAPTLTAPASTASVIIEAKLVTNKHLLTALRDQLVQRYLAATGQRHGIYLVYWIPPEQRPDGSPKVHADRDKLLKELRSLSAEVAPQYDVRPCVLDVSWPSPDSI